MDLSGADIATLRAGDFAGLVRLESLDLSANALSALPQGDFDERYMPKVLHLDGNRLASLPDGIFDELFLLGELALHDNAFAALPADLFEAFWRFHGTGSGGGAARRYGVPSAARARGPGRVGGVAPGGDGHGAGSGAGGVAAGCPSVSVAERPATGPARPVRAADVVSCKY